ncbi:MAG: N-acetyl-gamma-glutamyl-phosphate reductase [Candidatus Peribacteraceae bacterium]|nr:N-acetyl-gamma-glutamyl-phosphate reductase [Candidatus Peribacteraceae bacterium]
MSKQLSVAVIGASGYVGGELTRLLLGHPNFEIKFATSESFAGKLISKVHPNLRGATDLKFSKISEVKKVDIVFACLPHGSLATKISEIEKLGDIIIDSSADFRFRDSADFAKWYEGSPAADASKWVYGLPEIHREEIKKSKRIAVPGCTATAAILALLPLVDVVEKSKIIFDLKVASSGSGNKPNLGSHHPERAGVLRSYKLSGHRHTGEVIQELGLPDVPGYSITSTPEVRGIVCHAHAFLNSDLTDKEIWKLFREKYSAEPFVRIVKEAAGIHALPEAKILSGTNFCDVGWELDGNSNRIVAVSALDNLGKGAAGASVQCANLVCGFEEKAGLEFLGLHPA